MYLTPVVIEQTSKGERSYDIYSRLLKDRVIVVFGEITDELSASIISQMLFLASKGDEDIYLYINSPGGSVSSGLAIYDVMNYIKPDVNTIGIGLCASMGALLLSSGTKGKRYSLPNGEIMIHQPLGGGQGQVTDLEIMTKRLLHIKRKINSILAHNTNKPLIDIEKDTERDYFLDPIDALKYGLIDKII